MMSWISKSGSTNSAAGSLFSFSKTYTLFLMSARFNPQKARTNRCLLIYITPRGNKSIDIKIRLKVSSHSTTHQSGRRSFSEKKTRRYRVVSDPWLWSPRLYVSDEHTFHPFFDTCEVDLFGFIFFLGGSTVSTKKGVTTYSILLLAHSSFLLQQQPKTRGVQRVRDDHVQIARDKTVTTIWPPTSIQVKFFLELVFVSTQSKWRKIRRPEIVWYPVDECHCYYSPFSYNSSSLF